MSKKTKKQIKDYYSKEGVVTTYDDKRFAGPGGKYIHNNELSPILNYVDQIEKKKKRKLRILDLGAGRGRLSIPLLNKKHKVYCLDASEQMARVLRKSIDKNHLFVQSVFDPIETKTKFDVVVSLRFFDHFSIRDQKEIADNINKHLDIEGYLVYSTLNANSLESWLSVFFPYAKNNYYNSLMQYQNMFGELKLKVLDCDSRFFLPRGVFLRLTRYGFLIKILVLLDRVLSKFDKLSAYYVFLLSNQ